jgi:electron transport complex protein RnfD
MSSAAVPVSAHPAPHVRRTASTPALIWSVALCLLPAAAWGILVFGIPAALVLAATIGSALVCEALTGLLRREFTLPDGSAFLTGLMAGCLLPAGAPLYVAAAASAFAIVVVKQTFGGLGRNWMNPALAGVVFARVSWTGAFGAVVSTRWTGPAPAPLDALAAALSAPGSAAGRALDVLAAAGYPVSGADGRVVGWLNARLAPLGMSLPPGSLDLLVGIRAGGVGEVAVPLLLAGAAVLAARRIIRWQIPAAHLAAFAVLAWAFGGLGAGGGFFTGDVVFHLLAGSLLLVSFFMATDPVTSPLTSRGMIVYGVGLGAATFLLRFYGSMPDSAPLAVLLMNCTVPLIDRCTKPVRFAAQRRSDAGVADRRGGGR